MYHVYDVYPTYTEYRLAQLEHMDESMVPCKLGCVCGLHMHYTQVLYFAQHAPAIQVSPCCPKRARAMMVFRFCSGAISEPLQCRSSAGAVPILSQHSTSVVPAARPTCPADASGWVGSDLGSALRYVARIRPKSPKFGTTPSHIGQTVTYSTSDQIRPNSTIFDELRRSFRPNPANSTEADQVRRNSFRGRPNLAPK